MARGAREVQQLRADPQSELLVAGKRSAAVKAESCGDCGTYLKILYQEKDPKVEAVADNLASLILDAENGAGGLCPQLYQPVPVPG